MTETQGIYRARPELESRTTPRNRIQTKQKKITVRVQSDCADDVRYKKLANLQQDILNRSNYNVMTPLDLGVGLFEVHPDFLEEFKVLAGEHGFTVSEVEA